MTTPPSIQSGTIWDISLPQNDGFGEQVERRAQLALFQQGYTYDPNNTALPMPMATNEAAELDLALLVAERPLESDWVAGQLENQIAIQVDLTIWEVLRKLSSGTITSAQAASQIADLSARLPAPSSFDRTWDALKAWFTAPATPSDDPSTPPNLAAYADVYTTLPTPDIIQQWRDDRIFASQRLGGLNPMIIQRVSADGSAGSDWRVLRNKLSARINDAALLPFFNPPITLDQAVAANRLFVADYHELGAVIGDPDAPGWQKGRRIQAPIALYVRVDGFDGLQPVAIQLDQGLTGAHAPAVMLAADAGKPGQANNWLLARICVQAADLSYNQAVNHLGQTHLIEEAFVLATRRQLALQHPLNVLLSHHFSALLVINAIGSLTLLKPGATGLINQLLAPGLDGSLALIRNRYDRWSFDQLDFPADFTNRGVDTLPIYFPYRDDGQLIWTLLGQYATDYVGLYYLSDSDVSGDYELQAWARELSEEVNGKPRVPGFPSAITTIAKLIPIIHRLLWTASAQHAAVNFPQVDYASFIPNYPGATYRRPPGDFEGVVTTEQDLLATLAPVSFTKVQVSTTNALARYHYDQLLDYAATLSDPKAAALVTRYYDKLRSDIRTTIADRNAGRATTAGLLAYPYFLPENIPNSTSV